MQASASLFGSQQDADARTDRYRALSERSDPDIRLAHIAVRTSGDPTDTLVGLSDEDLSILKGSPAGSASTSNAAYSGRARAAVTSNACPPTTCRSAASTVPAQCDREACHLKRGVTFAFLDQYGSAIASESLAKRG